jgi:hypothetical protein
MAQAGPSSGIEGTIVISPGQGGPTRQGAPDTRPLPATEFVVRQGDQVVTTFRTDAGGHFQVSLGAGHYSIAKKEKGAMGSYGPFEVNVAAGKMKNVHWECDSGIR